MSVEAIGQLLERALSDPAFVTQLKTNFEAASRSYDLTPGEVSIIKSGDYMTLQQMGIEKQMTEALWRFLG